MKVLFLDFDGVLNSERYFDDRDALIVIPKSQPICPVAVARVQRIVDETGAKIVISSSWRLGDPLERLRSHLTNKGLRAANETVIDVTPWGLGVRRGREIEAWLRNADENADENVEAWVAIDDESPEEMHPSGARHVQTTWAEGLTDALADEAIRLLGATSLEQGRK